MKLTKRWPWLIVVICAPEVLIPLFLGGAGLTILAKTTVTGATLLLLGVGLGARLWWKRHSSTRPNLGSRTDEGTRISR